MFVEEKKQGEAKELDAASKLLLKAANLIEEVGLAKEALHNEDGYCVLGALNRTCILDAPILEGGGCIRAESRCSEILG